MSRHKRGGLSPSLFPFLAVLVCTLGTLILLLALVAQDATDAAAHAAKSPANDTSSPPSKPQALPTISARAARSMIDEEQFRVQQLVAFRDQQTVDLEDRRDQMTHLEDHITRLQDQLKRLSDEVDRVMDDKPIKNVDQATLVAFRTKINQERKQIEELRRNSGSKTPRVVIVPHKGPNGTDRRAVYLECDREGLTIWPEGVRITKRELEDSDSSANPLDASLRIIRHHSMQTYGEMTPPYPLLVVRPDGIETYAAAFDAIGDWDDQFGYELVPAEMKLAFANPDTNLKKRLDIAIHKATALQTQKRYAGFGNRGYAGGTRPRVLSAADLDRDGRANGYQTTRGREDFAAMQRRRASFNGSGGYGASGFGSTANGQNKAGGFSAGGNGDSPSANPNSNDPNSIDPATEKRWVDDMRSAAQEMRSAGNTFGSSSPLADSFMPTQLNSPQHPSGPQTEASASSSQASTSQNEWGTENAGDSNVNGNGGTAGSEGTNSQQTASTGTQGGGAPQASSANSTQSGPPSGSNQHLDSQQRQAMASASPSMNQSSQRQMVQRQGKDWALPSEIAGAHGNAIVRTIRVQSYADRFVLPASRSGPGETFLITDHGNADRGIDRATIELASAVRDRVARWGVALPGGRWQPRLEVEVMPGSESRFEQFHSLMDGSGVEVERKASR